jgi:serine/threonine protein kinase
MAVLLGRVMEDEGLLSHFFREHPFENTQNFYVFLGPCAALVQPGSQAGCGSAAQLVFSTAEAAAAAAAAAEAACSTTPGCRLLRFLHEHDLEPLYAPLFQVAKMDYHDVMLAFAQPDAADMFIQLGLDDQQFAALQLAVSESIDRRLEKLGRDPAQRSASGHSMGSEDLSRGSDTDRGRGASKRSGSASSGNEEEEQVRGLIEADANDGPAIRSWVIEDPDEIERDNFIAEGTTGKVYKGQWQGMPVAVKVYKPGTLTEATKANAMNEVQLMRRMQHQFLLRLYGACMTPPNLIIVSELCVGSLSSLLYGRLSTAPGSTERLTPKWEHAFVRGIATGVSFLHKHNVAHRDLKSANVLFDRSLMPKLCDFAFSKHKMDRKTAGQAEEEPEFSSAVGTPQWMAPEVLRGEIYTTSADVWSFGVVVWEIKHRKRPYEGTSAYAVQYKVASEGLRPVVNPKLPQFWQYLMDDCFSPGPESRPSSHEIQQRLIDESPPAPSRTRRAAAPVSAVVTAVSPRAAARPDANVGIKRFQSEPTAKSSDQETGPESPPQQQDGQGNQQTLPPASAPASAREPSGKSWEALGARGDTAATLEPQQWQAARPSATATALAMVLDARDARMRQTENQSVQNARGQQEKCDESSSDGQRTPQSEWFVSAGTGKPATAAA